MGRTEEPVSYTHLGRTVAGSWTGRRGRAMAAAAPEHRADKQPAPEAGAAAAVIHAVVIIAPSRAEKDAKHDQNDK